VDFNAFLSERRRRSPRGRSRLCFGSRGGADEPKSRPRKIERRDKPGEREGRIDQRNECARRRDPSAALDCKWWMKRVFALAEKQPGFAKVFLPRNRKEVMKPRYEIQSIGMPEIVETRRKSEGEAADGGAARVFSTEIVSANKVLKHGSRPDVCRRQGMRRHARRYQVRS